MKYLFGMSFAICVSLMSNAVAAGLSIDQRVIALQLKELILKKAVVQRIADECADFAVDEKKLVNERDSIRAVAQPKFASNEEFIKAAGADEKEVLAEEIRRYFLDRGVVWESSTPDYCTLGKALIMNHTKIGEYLKRR